MCELLTRSPRPGDKAQESSDSTLYPPSTGASPRQGAEARIELAIDVVALLSMPVVSLDNVSSVSVVAPLAPAAASRSGNSLGVSLNPSLKGVRNRSSKP